MCGIFGFSELTENTRRLAPVLGLLMEARGDDSWGAAGNGRYLKFGCAISKNFELPEYFNDRPLIVHTRAASVGAVCMENAHPFYFEKENNEGWICGIHNGHINNHKDLAKQYNREFKVDSMHIYRHILDGNPLSELNGWGALAWFDSLRGNLIINMARFNMNDLSVVRLETGEIIFASTRIALDKACGLTMNKIKSHFPIGENKRYQIELPEDPNEFACLREMEEMKFGVRYASSAGAYSSSNNSNRNVVLHFPSKTESLESYAKRLHDEEKCGKCKENKVSRGKKLLCIECESDAYDEFMNGTYQFKIGNDWVTYDWAEATSAITTQ
jgi:asparagine synthetase B (glutamine-hydrolysing)